MTKFLLIVHVLAAIIAVGPVTVAASMFPAAVRRAGAADEGDAGTDAGSGAGSGGTGAGPAVVSGTSAVSLASVRILHRICQVYALVGVAVPVFGLATAKSLGVLTDAWLLVSMVLTAGAAGVLALLVLPGQRTVLALLERSDAVVERSATVRLAMYTGIFNVLWAVVTALMIIRPGSTTGA